MKNSARMVVLVLTSVVCHACLPPSDPYPYAPPAELLAEAHEISDNLEAYITAWTEGNAGDSIPDTLIPDGVSDSEDFYLADPDSVTAAQTWATRLARPIDQDSLRGGIPDPNATYLFLGTMLAPFGSKIVIEGEFPHARFFSFQITAPFDGQSYYADRQFGGAEVSIVDVDIEPLPGHVNPYRPGADRNADDRSYRLTFDLAAGDPVALNNGAFTPPYRGAGNGRTGAAIVHQGPLGFKTVTGVPLPADVAGPWNLGALWVRIYRPDDGSGPLGGVEMPRVSFELPNGERYFIGSDFSRLQERADRTIANRDVEMAPNPYFGPEVGWFKSWGIARSMLTGVCQANGWSRQDSAGRVNDIVLGWTGRGELQNAPQNYEPHATTNNYCNYLGRKVDIEEGNVLVLTGKLPTFPDTGPGLATMETAEVRYWSIIGIDEDALSPLPATTIHAVSDEEVIIDQDRNFMIVYSSEADRPANATAANGVTWVNSGTQTQHGLLLRWVSIADDWLAPFAPSEERLPWAISDWAGSAYDSTLIGVNWWEGAMKCYLPRLHRFSATEFAGLGNELAPSDIPVWLEATYTTGPTYAHLATASASGQLGPDNPPDGAIDGDLTSSWATEVGGNPLKQLVVELDTLRAVSDLKLIWDPIFFATHYSIATSPDNENWTTIYEAENVAAGGPTIIRPATPALPARFLMLEINAGNLAFSSLLEFEVYSRSCDCPEVVSSLVESVVPPAPTLSVFPNPVADVLYFRCDRSVIKATLYDNRGNRLLTVRKPEGELALSRYPPGIYFLEVETTDGRQTQRVIKAY